VKADGDCYPAAARFLLSLGRNTDARLVHGVVSGQGKLAGVRFGHAWVEINGWVIDPSNGKKLCMARDRYYQLGKIDPSQSRSYSYQEVLRATVQSGHYGPWESP
jgi:hypothetical protein